MILAELVLHCSRPIAPTRRIALGDSTLPVDPAPGFGGILLGGVVATFAPKLDEDLTLELHTLVHDIEAGRRISQPRLRHRFQTDRIGLQRCRHRLHGDGETLHFSFDADRATAAQHVLGAVYAAAQLPAPARARVLQVVQAGLRWVGGSDDRLLAHLSGSRAPHFALGDPVLWALEVLALARGARPLRADVQRAFREQVRLAHPDHGGEDEEAADRIAELTEARRILLS